MKQDVPIDRVEDSDNRLHVYDATINSDGQQMGGWDRFSQQVEYID